MDIAVAPHQHTNANFLSCGNVRWILCATICSGKYVSTPLRGDSTLIDTLSPLGTSQPFFTVPFDFF